MIKLFQNDDEGYLAWVAAHQNGFVVNTDNPPSQLTYPMVHVASHNAISSPTRTNYTTAQYIKYCSLNLAALDQYVQKEHGRVLHRCGICMRKGRGV